MIKTFFPGSKSKKDCGRVNAGFALFATLWVILGLSFVCASALSAVKVRHAVVLKASQHFYADLEDENKKWADELHRSGFWEETYAAD